MGKFRTIFFNDVEKTLASSLVFSNNHVKNSTFYPSVFREWFRSNFYMSIFPLRHLLITIFGPKSMKNLKSSSTSSVIQNEILVKNKKVSYDGFWIFWSFGDFRPKNWFLVLFKINGPRRIFLLNIFGSTASSSELSQPLLIFMSGVFVGISDQSCFSLMPIVTFPINFALLNLIWCTVA